jgi:hypothetical protein
VPPTWNRLKCEIPKSFWANASLARPSMETISSFGEWRVVFYKLFNYLKKCQPGLDGFSYR